MVWAIHQKDIIPFLSKLARCDEILVNVNFRAGNNSPVVTLRDDSRESGPLCITDLFQNFAHLAQL